MEEEEECGRLNPNLSEVQKEAPRERAKRYIPSPGLKDACEIAIELGMPMLVTGAPGTGKTDLGHYIADHYLDSDPFIFHTKSTSIHTDLFYQYDALSHFRAGQTTTSAAGFITLQALGKAIERAGANGQRSVVLVDEVDKAPRDLPNDILNEIENMEFTIKETGTYYKADPRHQPILVFTSNQEKDLPDAFLRRCVFYYIDFKEVPLEEIIRTRFRLDARPDAKELADRALTHFLSIQSIGLERPPATAELIAWVDYLIRRKLDVTDTDPKSRDVLAVSYSLLAKSDDDLKKIKKPK
jgi:MoxR-like ATPase